MSRPEISPLFGFREDWWHNACVNFTHNDWDLYAAGYRRAAEVLVEHVRETQTWQDTLLYPIVFLYRHYLELRLKLIIRDGSWFLHGRPEVPVGHQIESLWGTAREIIEQMSEQVGEKAAPGDPSAPLDEVADLVREFVEIDPGSTSFRYPRDRSGDCSLPGVRYINIAQLQERINPVADFLEGVCCGISHYLSAQADMMRDLER
jgi:hypothetical protein